MVISKVINKASDKIVHRTKKLLPTAPCAHLIIDVPFTVTHLLMTL